MSPKSMTPSPNCTFADVYSALQRMPNQEVSGLHTTGGVEFSAKADLARDGRKYIGLPHNNRIYRDDWGFMTNHMGEDGQRIGHYARPLDDWCSGL